MTRRAHIRNLLLFSAFGASAGPAPGADLLVPAAFETLQDAVAAAGPGDRILVAAGVYRGPVTIPGGATGLRLAGEGKVWLENDPTVPESGAVLRVLADDVSVEGLAFRHGGPNSGDPISGGVHVDADGATLKDLRIERCAGPGIRVFGNDARVESCSVRGCQAGVIVVGHGAVVRDCAVAHVRNDGVDIEGADATVRGCKVESSHSRGIRVDGPRGKVRDNVVRATAYEGILVSGFDMKVLDNDIATTGASYASLRVGPVGGDHTAEFGGAIVKGNRCVDGGGAGIWLTSEEGGGSEIVDNVVLRCGVPTAFKDGAASAGIQVEGASHEILDNTVKQCAGDGLLVDGGVNRIVGNRIVKNLEDGIEIASGAANDVRENESRGNLGEGFENGGTSTLLVDNVIKKNRLDVASTGTFGQYAGNWVQSGGPDHPPEVD